ncbi:DUF3006 domain-containing protein [Peribacillus loiseleuriae]|uniref:DUF3006 domain-containing protein n=1 Tax=Peribacillus loiseleuriae TaxID=1679170 RepID=UPI003D028862
MKCAKYVIDRFEDDFAILLLKENESIQIDVSKDQLPETIKEGDILELQLSAENEIINVRLLKEETNSAKKRAEDLLQKILNKNN